MEQSTLSTLRFPAFQVKQFFVPPATPRINSLTQGIAIVRLMVQAGYSLGVTNIARTMNMPKSSVHRLLQSLQQLGFVYRTEAGRYTISADIFDFIHDIASNFGRNLRLDDQLRAAAQRLNCSVYLSMLGQRDTFVICAAGDEGNTARLGIHARAYTSSAGKVLIAQKSSKLWADYAPRPEEKPVTPFSNQDPDKFLAELNQVRKLGLAWNHRESSERHVSLAMAVREPFIAIPRLSVAFVLRQDNFETRDPAQLEADLRDFVLEIEQELGSR